MRRVRRWAAAWGGMSAMVLAAVLLTATATKAATAATAVGPARATPDLRLLAWPNYIPPELLEKFRKETGVSVTVEEYDADEVLLSRLKEHPGTYDLATPGDVMTNRLIRAGLIERIDGAKLPGFGNVSLQWRSPPYDPNNLYHVPFDWGTTSFMVDIIAYDGPADSLALLFEPPDALKGKVGMLRDVSDVIGLAVRYLGVPRCSTEPAHLDRIRKLLERQKPSVLAYDAEELVDTVVAGRTVVQMVWNGDAIAARLRRPTLRYVYPKEGVAAWTDSLVVPKGAPHRESALRFISFMMQPENSAIQANFSHYGSPIQGVEEFLDEELRNAPEIIMPVGAKADFLGCSPEAMEAYQTLWEGILPK